MGCRALDQRQLEGNQVIIFTKGCLKFICLTMKLVQKKIGAFSFDRFTGIYLDLEIIRGRTQLLIHFIFLIRRTITLVLYRKLLNIGPQDSVVHMDYLTVISGAMIWIEWFWISDLIQVFLLVSFTHNACLFFFKYHSSQKNVHIKIVNNDVCQREDMYSYIKFGYPGEINRVEDERI